MKILIRSSAALLLAVVLIFSLCACGKKTQPAADLWNSAVYQSDTELGSGAKMLTVEVEAEEKSVKFTLHTDMETVGEALFEQNLISGEDGEYGLYIKEVNGITADYDVDQTYWAFYIDGEYAMSGVDATDITEGTEYRLVRSK